MTELEKRIEHIARLYLDDRDAHHFISKVRDVLSVPPGMGWRPMHTAPTTGSGEKPIRILVRVPGHGVRFGRVIQEGEHRIEFVDQMSGVEPDGWMPLPDMAHGYTFEDAPEEREGHRARERIQELCAQVERLREALTDEALDLIRCGIGSNYGDGLREKAIDRVIGPIKNALKETPAQSLREIRAEAGREGYMAAARELMDWRDTSCPNEYANQIRSGEHE